LQGQFLYRNRNVNHGRSTFRLHQEQQRSAIRFLWSEGVSGSKSIENFQHDTGTVFFRNGVSIRIDGKIKKWPHKCYT
jgi:hypothetical protein